MNHLHLPFILSHFPHAPWASQDNFIALLRYFAVVISDGDYLNDWLTHLPPTVAVAAQVIGQWILPLFKI